MLVLALLPVWFPWVLKPLLNHYGLDFAEYKRTGWSQFTLNEVTGRWPDGALKLRQVEGDLPMVWLWNKFTRGTNGSPFLIVRDGELNISQPVEAKAENSPGSLDETLNDAGRIASLLAWVLPSAQLTNCSVQIGANRMQLPHAEWRDGQLNAAVRLPELQGELVIDARTKGPDFLGLTVKSEEYDASFRGEFTRFSAGWQLKSDADWLTNRATITAQFATNGWWPLQAQLNCQEFVVPAEMVRRYGYENVITTFSANAASNHFSLQASGSARPTGEFATNGFPAGNFSLVANGNPDLVNLEELHIQSPWLNANLTNSVGITWNGELLAKPAQLRVALDLSQLPAGGYTGRADGVVHVTPRGRRQPPVAQFNFAASQLHLRQVEVENFVVRGNFDSPKLELIELMADTKDGSKLEAGGSYDFRSQQITDGTWKLSGRFLEQLLPGIHYDALAGSGQVQGPLTNLEHAGEMTLKGFQTGRLKPINGHATWNGHDLRLDALNARLAAGESILALNGTVDLGALAERKILATVTNLSLSRSDEELYALQHPCVITFSAAGTNVSPAGWSLAVDGFDWHGANREVSMTADLAWPARGMVTAAITNLAFDDFSDFLTNEIPNVSVENFQATSQWSNGPIHSTIFLSGSLTNRDGQSFALRSELTTGDSFSVKQLSVESGYAPMLSVTGNIPVQALTGPTGILFDWDKSQSIALTGTLVDAGAQPFTVALATNGVFKVQKPELSFHLSGTLDEPSASIQAGVASISWQPAATTLPGSRLEELQLDVEVRRDGIKLDRLSARLDGQPVQATGDWPLSPGDWRAAWTKKKLPDWNNAQGRLQVEDLQMAAVARYLPQFLAPEGELNASLELKPGKQLEGQLSLTNAATRPLGNLSSLRDIDAQIRFDGQRGVLQNFRGQIGGQPVLANGFADLGAPEGLRYELNLSGTNVPLARSLELLLRGDFDLHFQGASNLPPVISGNVNLRDGLFVQHASGLIWSGPKTTGLRPPFFSVTNQPMADWKLDVTVTGKHFLRVRTPVFYGLVSANAQIRGKLREPVATGDAHVDSGRITFPFGTMDVDDGFASLSGNDPHGPKLQFHASGRTLDYDVNLVVNGPADGAIIEFTSTPPLSSQEILLLLTAGEVPQQQYTFSNQARAGRVATFLGKDLFSRFFGGGDMEDRLIINTGQDISEEGKLTYSVEYRLTDRWSIIGEYDQFNDYNAGVKWRVLSR